MDIGKIITILIIGLIGFITGVYLLPNPFYKKKAIINIKCGCKYNGPYYGRILERDKNELIKDSLIICWWEMKRKALSGEIFYDIVKIHKKSTDEGGNFFIPGYPEKNDKYICCPKCLIYNKEYINFIDFSRKIDCFKNKEGCIIYLKKLSDEEKAEILKIIPADVREILKGSLSNYEKKNNLIGENR